jgi:hypothetical protein
MSDDEIVETHPSYGMVGLSKTTGTGGGQTRLFGSALDRHYGTIRLTIRRAERHHDLHRDWYFGRQELIEVEMSAAQFVEFVTSPNVGSGVPCTLRYRTNDAGQIERIPDPPAVKTESVQITDSIEDSIASAVKRMRTERAEIETITSGLSAKLKEKLRVRLDVMIQQLDSNVPFILSQFKEATGRVVSAAKNEVESFVSTVLHRAGMEAIAEGRLPKLLSGGNDAVEDGDRPSLDR